MSVQFAVLASGSQGNATLIRAGGAGTLLDLGVGPRSLDDRLGSVGSSWDQVTSALLTHTHADHVGNATLHRMARERAVLYCHEGHRDTLLAHSGYLALEHARLVRHYDERPFLTATGLRVEPLELRHDGPTFGFRIEAMPTRKSRPVSMGYLADTGSWSDLMAEAMAEVDLLGVEFNHDVEMQLRANRPAALIERNLSDWGHLSNEQGAGFVAAVLGRSRPASVRHVVLLHLSRQCNHPDLAIRAASDAVRESGRTVFVETARQESAHPNVMVEPARRRVAVARLRPDAKA